MQTTIVKLGMENGIERKKISFVYPNEGNILANAQSHFTKEEKKLARLNHKANESKTVI